MSITGIIMAAVIVGGTGLFIGIFLGLADKKLTVKVDEKEEAILGVLPGNNCGGCGYPGCSGLAAAIVKGEAPVDQCPVGGAPVAAKIGAIMGQEVKETARQVAFVKCAGTCDKTTVKYEYSILESVVNGFATGVGYLIAIVLLAGIREKMEYNDIPESFQGMPIVLLTAALMAIAFFGFSGIV